MKMTWKCELLLLYCVCLYISTECISRFHPLEPNRESLSPRLSFYLCQSGLSHFESEPAQALSALQFFSPSHTWFPVQKRKKYYPA